MGISILISIAHWDFMNLPFTCPFRGAVNQSTPMAMLRTFILAAALVAVAAGQDIFGAVRADSQAQLKAALAAGADINERQSGTVHMTRVSYDAFCKHHPAAKCS